MFVCLYADARTEHVGEDLTVVADADLEMRRELADNRVCALLAASLLLILPSLFLLLLSFSL